MNKILNLVVLVEQDEDGVYIARVPSLRGCHSHGKTVAEALESVKEAAQLCIAELEEEPYSEKFVGVHQLEIAV